jgi:hypothetical protein
LYNARVYLLIFVLFTATFITDYIVKNKHHMANTTPKETVQDSPSVEGRVRYPERLSYEGPDYVIEIPPQDPEALGAEWAETIENYADWEWEYNDTARALNLDFTHYIASLSPEEQTKLLAPINASRELHGAEPIDAHSIGHSELKLHMMRPDWHEYFPRTDDPQEMAAWGDFRAQWPEYMQTNLDALREADIILRSLAQNETLREDVNAERAEQLNAIRTAVHWRRATKKIDQVSEQMAHLHKIAATSKRQLTLAERNHLVRLGEQEQAILKERNEYLGEHITTVEAKEEVKKVIENMVDRERRREFENGLVLTEQMRETIDDVLPSLMAGRPVLFVGDTGGAKTALAEFISRQYLHSEPELISGYADINSYQVIGKEGFIDGETQFIPGAIPRAMERGQPVILDEITAMPADFLKRLNKILQLRPGDSFTIQEDSGREVIVQPGFAIIATANEKSKRYKGIDDLSVEFLNRFGANVIRVHYPDHDIVFSQDGALPADNLIIARASLSDKRGNLPDFIDEEELVNFVKACYTTQQVFTGNYGNGIPDFRTPDDIADRKPGLEETVLAPRTMTALLEKLRDSHGASSLEKILTQFVDGVKNPKDKKQLILILQGQGFLKAQSQAQSNPFQ